MARPKTIVTSRTGSKGVQAATKKAQTGTVDTAAVAKGAKPSIVDFADFSKQRASALDAVRKGVLERDVFNKRYMSPSRFAETFNAQITRGGKTIAGGKPTPAPAPAPAPTKEVAPTKAEPAAVTPEVVPEVTPTKGAAEKAFESFQEATAEPEIVGDIKTAILDRLSEPTDFLDRYNQLAEQSGLPELQGLIQAGNQQAQDLKKELEAIEGREEEATREVDLTQSQFERRVSIMEEPVRKQLTSTLESVAGLKDIYESSRQELSTIMGFMKDSEELELANLEKALEISKVPEEDRKLARDLLLFELEDQRLQEKFKREDFTSERDFQETLTIEGVKNEFRLARDVDQARVALDKMLFEANIDQREWFLENLGTEEPTDQQIKAYQSFLNSMNALEMASEEASIASKLATTARTRQLTRKGGKGTGTGEASSRIKRLADEIDDGLTDFSDISQKDQEEVSQELDRREAEAEAGGSGDEGEFGPPSPSGGLMDTLNNIIK